jgi:tRNA threonylcarbamoyladenosine biosynthesis protein TsaE
VRQSRLILEASRESDTQAAGQALARALPGDATGLLLALEGDLGAGKTTLARALLRTLGATGPVRSPTYTLVEPYDLPGGQVLHVDLYRLSGADELEALGYRESRGTSRLTMVEWPERAPGALGPVDLACRIDYAGAGRRLTLVPGTEAGAAWLQRLTGDRADQIAELS